MIPILYSANETTFTHNGIGRLVDCTKCLVTEERNGIFECEFSYPIEGQFYSEISLDRIIKAKPNEMSDDQLFRIYRISKPMNGIVSVYCQHISYDLAVNVVIPFSILNDSAQSAMNEIFNHLSKPNQYTYTCIATVGGTHNFKVETPISVRQALGGEEGSLLDVFGGEFEFDNFNIKLHQRRGQDRGVTILYGKNLTDAKAETNMTDAYTAILPYAVNEEDDTPVHLLDGVNKTIAIDGAPTYGEPRVLAVDLTSMYDLQEEDITSANLRQRANTYLSENDLKTISHNIEISFVQLWQTEEYKNIAVLERVALCDTVTVRYEKLGIDATAKVVKTVYDTLREKYESIEIGDAKSTFLEALRKEAKEQGKKAVKENYSAMQAAIDSATELITGQTGGYIIFRNSTTIFDSSGNVLETKTLPEGQPAEMLIMDKPDVNTASKVWRYNLSGWGYSSTGVNGPFRLAATSDGSIVADFITTGNLNAGRITTGILQDAQQKNYWNLNNGKFRLSQSNAFDSLTHNGDALGIYMVPISGTDYYELRINANYIKTGTVDASVVNVTNINASNISTGIIRDQTNATAKNYWNLATGEFRLTAGTKVYKDDGTDSGIFYKANGELRINADYIKTGTLSANLITTGALKSSNNQTELSLSSGDITIVQDNGEKLKISGYGLEFKNNNVNRSFFNGHQLKLKASSSEYTMIDTQRLYFSNGLTNLFIKPDSNYSAIELPNIIAADAKLKSLNIPYRSSNNTYIDVNGMSYGGKQLSPIAITVNNIDYIVLGYQQPAPTNRLNLSNTSYNGCAFDPYYFEEDHPEGNSYKLAAYKKGVASSARSITNYSYLRQKITAYDKGTHYVVKIGGPDTSSTDITEMVDSSNNVYTLKFVYIRDNVYDLCIGYDYVEES